MKNIKRKDIEGEYIILGDFNLHHPSWGGTGIQSDTEAEDLLEVMDLYNIEMINYGARGGNLGKEGSEIDN